jgi:superfamily II DNA/RNA helicase
MKEEDYVHRIGRTGRAGRTGLAVTLAERRDSGMIQRIQRFTTQRIPAATIEGLEPRRPEPRAVVERIAPSFDKARRGPPGASRPSFGADRPAFGADRRPAAAAPWGAKPAFRGPKPRPAR